MFRSNTRTRQLVAEWIISGQNAYDSNNDQPAMWGLLGTAWNTCANSTSCIGNAIFSECAIFIVNISCIMYAGVKLNGAAAVWLHPFFCLSRKDFCDNGYAYLHFIGLTGKHNLSVQFSLVFQCFSNYQVLQKCKLHETLAYGL